MIRGAKFAGAQCQYGHNGLRYVRDGTCVECRLSSGVARYKADPLKRKAAVRKSKGLPEPTRPDPTFCECCGRMCEQDNLCIDHDHETGAFRGWLCGKCNRGIGLLGDSVSGVTQALKYLKRAQKP